MNKDFLLSDSQSGKEIYSAIKDLPIIDYHCHLSPKEIYENKPFEDIADIWLGGDHYKWRLMRSAGIDEKYITGDASGEEKFIKYIECLSYAAGNPLLLWSRMELSLYFGIDIPILPENAKEIYDTANKVIKEKKLSPRMLINESKVEALCTTDDPSDPLKYHELIKNDDDIKFKVIPSFRTDNIMNIRKEGYPEYIKKFSDTCKANIDSLSSLKKALSARINDFAKMGAIFSDIGIEAFPASIYDDEKASAVFSAALNKKEISDADFSGFLGNTYLFFAGEYKKHNMIMQLHLAVKRNADTKKYISIGADCGGDTIGDVIPASRIINLLDEMNKKDILPKTVLYALNSSMIASLSGIAGSFPNVIMGAAWWFCDHKRGIEEQISVIAETGYIATFLGMLTDSRSFLSYARHDYFRRILANLLGSWVDKGEYDLIPALELAKRISYKNIKNIFDGGNI